MDVVSNEYANVRECILSDVDPVNVVCHCVFGECFVGVLGDGLGIVVLCFRSHGCITTLGSIFIRLLIVVVNELTASESPVASVLIFARRILM